MESDQRNKNLDNKVNNNMEIVDEIISRIKNELLENQKMLHREFIKKDSDAKKVSYLEGVCSSLTTLLLMIQNDNILHPHQKPEQKEKIFLTPRTLGIILNNLPDYLKDNKIIFDIDRDGKVFKLNLEVKGQNAENGPFKLCFLEKKYEESNLNEG